MLVWCVLAFSAIGVVHGTMIATSTTTKNKDRGDKFLQIVTGHGGTSLPILVWPVLINSEASDSDEALPDGFSLKSMKFSLAPQYLAKYILQTTSRIGYMMVENPQQSDNADESNVVAEYGSSNREPNRPVNRLQPEIGKRRRVKIVTKISPVRKYLPVIENLILNTTPSREYIPVTKPNTHTPEENTIITETPASQEYIPVTESIISNTPPLRDYIQVTETNEPSFIENTPGSENVIPITPSPPQDVKYITKYVILDSRPSINDDQSRDNPKIIIQNPEDTSDQPKAPSDHPQVLPSPEKPNPSDLPKNPSEAPIKPNRPEDPAKIQKLFFPPWNPPSRLKVTMKPFDLPKKITMQLQQASNEKPLDPSRDLSKQPKAPTATVEPSGLPKSRPERPKGSTKTELSFNLPKTTSEKLEDVIVTKAPSDLQKDPSEKAKDPNTTAEMFDLPMKPPTKPKDQNTSGEIFDLPKDPFTRLQDIFELPKKPSIKPQNPNMGGDRFNLPKKPSTLPKNENYTFDLPQKPSPLPKYDNDIFDLPLKPSTLPKYDNNIFDLPPKLSTLSKIPNTGGEIFDLPKKPSTLPENENDTFDLPLKPSTLPKVPNTGGEIFDLPKGPSEPPITIPTTTDKESNLPSKPSDITKPSKQPKQPFDDQKHPSSYKGVVPKNVYVPFSFGRDQLFVTTPEMIESYRREKPNRPELPSVMPSGRTFPKRLPLEADNPLEASIPGPTPPVPRFRRSMRLRVDVRVPRSDYTEAYDVQWHAASNTVRTVIEDGYTIFYRVPLLDGRLQYLKFKVDQLNGTALRRCMLSPIIPASPSDQDFPALPDLTPFNFVGYTEAEGKPLVERWRHWVIGRPGMDGAVQGESLNYTHDFLLYRNRGLAVPLKYTVVIHSSILGPYSDSYTHRYRLMRSPKAPMLPDMGKMCQVVERMKEESLPLNPKQGLYLTKKPSSDAKKVPLPNRNYSANALLDKVLVVPNAYSETGNLGAVASDAGIAANMKEIRLPIGDNTANANSETENQRAVVASNKAGIAANINIGTDNLDANLVSDRGGIVANINIGAGLDAGLVTRGGGIVANINIGAGGLSTGQSGTRRGAANLIFGSEGLDTGLTSTLGKSLSNLNFGTRVLDTGVASSTERGGGNLNFGTPGLKTGLTSNKGTSGPGINSDKVGVGINFNTSKGVFLTEKASSKAKNRLNIEKEELGVGETTEGGGVDTKLDTGKEAFGTVAPDKSADNSKIGEEKANKAGVYTNLNKNKGDLSMNGTRDISTSNGNVKDTNPKNRMESDDLGDIGNIISDAVKDFFNPIGEFLGTTRPKKYDNEFDDFKKEYKRKYMDDGEEAVRKTKFISTNRFVNAANRIATTFRTGINFFADRLKEESKQLQSGVVLEDEPAAGEAPEPSEYEKDFLNEENVNRMVENDLMFDWRKEGFETAVLFQGVCNCCALMVTTAATEAALFIKNMKKQLTPLSPQPMLDCGAKRDLKYCAPTKLSEAFRYIKEEGLPAMSSYAFRAPESLNEMPMMCKSVVKIETKISKFYKLRRSETNSNFLRLAIKTRSPVPVVLPGFDYNSFSTYVTGILDDTRCKDLTASHAVLAVGYDFTQKDQESFIIKNSWGETWGLKGYAQIKPNGCQILSHAMYPII